MQRIKMRLGELSEESYRDFTASLIPNVDRSKILGIRMPLLRALASKIQRDGELMRTFLSSLPHGTLDENNLHAILIGKIKDPDKCLAEVERFLPYIDNWATCDTLRPRVLRDAPSILTPGIERWLKSEHSYTVRFGIECLMLYYLNERFDMRYPELVAGVSSDDYYVNMMIAWYFATALACRYDEILPFLTERRLSPWVHNKTISKACDSRCISKEKKDELRALRKKQSFCKLKITKKTPYFARA